jgi:site-specific recombinase XerC
VRIYRAWLVQLQAQAGDAASALDGAAVTRFFVDLRKRGLSPSSVHQAFRTLKTFSRWLVATGALDRNPLAGVSMRTPNTLPQVPSEDEFRSVLALCPATLDCLLLLC